MLINYFFVEQFSVTIHCTVKVDDVSDREQSTRSFLLGIHIRSNAQIITSCKRAGYISRTIACKENGLRQGRAMNLQFLLHTSFKRFLKIVI